MSVGLTAKQKAMLAFLRSYILREGVAPTYHEMQVALGLASKSLVFRLVRALEERGAIRRLPNRNRSITLVEDLALPADLEQRVADYCRRIGITRPVFDQRAAESLLRGRA